MSLAWHKWRAGIWGRTDNIWQVCEQGNATRKSKYSHVASTRTNGSGQEGSPPKQTVSYILTFRSHLAQKVRVGHRSEIYSSRQMYNLLAARLHISHIVKKKKKTHLNFDFSADIYLRSHVRTCYSREWVVTSYHFILLHQSFYLKIIWLIFNHLWVDRDNTQ